MVEENKGKLQNIILESRKKITVSDVIAVESFDESTVTLITTLGILQIKGIEIKIEKLNLELGEVVASGNFYLTEYISDDNVKGGFFSRLFK